MARERSMSGWRVHDGGPDADRVYPLNPAGGTFLSADRAGASNLQEIAAALNEIEALRARIADLQETLRAIRDLCTAEQALDVFEGLR